MKFQPLGERVLVKVDSGKDRTAGGIYVPDQAKRPAQMGVIEAVGPGKLLDNGTFRALHLEVGQKVTFARHAGQEIKLDGHLPDEIYLLLHESEIGGVVSG